MIRRGGGLWAFWCEDGPRLQPSVPWAEMQHYKEARIFSNIFFSYEKNNMFNSIFYIDFYL